MFVCMYVCRYVFMYVCMYVFIYVCMYLYMYVCIRPCCLPELTRNRGRRAMFGTPACCILPWLSNSVT